MLLTTGFECVAFPLSCSFALGVYVFCSQCATCAFSGRPTVRIVPGARRDRYMSALVASVSGGAAQIRRALADPFMCYGTEPVGLDRARVQTQLESYPGRQLATAIGRPRPYPIRQVLQHDRYRLIKVVWARGCTGGVPGSYDSTIVGLAGQPDSNPPKVSPYSIRQNILCWVTKS